MTAVSLRFALMISDLVGLRGVGTEGSGICAAGIVNEKTALAAHTRHVRYLDNIVAFGIVEVPQCECRPSHVFVSPALQCSTTNTLLCYVVR